MFLMPSLPAAYEACVIEDISGLTSLRSEWDQLAPARHVEPWRSFIWIESAAAAFCRDHELRVITLRKKGNLTAVAPLALKRSEQPLKPRRVDFIGGEELKEPNQVIASDQSSLELLADLIVSEPVYPIRLSRLVENGGWLDLLLMKFKRAGWITRMMSMPYPFIDLTINPFKKSLREDLRRSRRKAEKSGTLSMETVDGFGSQNLTAHLLEAFHIESSGWKGRNGTAIIHNPARKDFFERFGCAALAEGILRLDFLKIGEQKVAAQYALASAGSYWLLNIGYDEQHRHCSPGSLLLAESIRQAAADGLVRFNLLGKEEPWVQRWTRQTQDCLVLAAYRPNLCGCRAMLSDALYLLQKRLRERRRDRLKSSRTPSDNLKN